METDAPTARDRGPARPRNRWLLREPADSPMRLFCLPYSGCGASMYRAWPRFTGDLETCPVQPPGRENRLRERGHGTYQELAADALEHLGPYFDRPFGLFGHCGSALAAFELAVQLCTNGRRAPAAVFVSSQVAPQDGPYGTLLTMDDTQLRQALRDLFVEMGNPTPSEDLLDVCMRTLRVDVRANARYVMPEPYRLPMPLVSIGWTDDDKVTPAQMAGWPRCGPTIVRVLSGHHFSFLDAPQALLDTFVETMTYPQAAEEPPP
jgi:surfactin synthase thioesterase subunit